MVHNAVGGAFANFLDVATFAPTLAAMIGLGVGIDYALFIVSRHRNQVKAGMEIEESIARANGTAGTAVVFAGLTVLIALAGLNGAEPTRPLVPEAERATFQFADSGLLAELEARDGATGYDFRKLMAARAFAATAAYDAMISQWFAFADQQQLFPEMLAITATRQEELRYGENPHQRAALYLPRGPHISGIAGAQPVPGKAVFERDGKTYELLAIDEGADEPLFFVISDGTSGKETYGAARFIYAEAPKDGKVILDFNRAASQRHARPVGVNERGKLIGRRQHRYLYWCDN